MELLREYGVAKTIYFPLITAGGTDFQAVWTPATGETQLSKDGGTFTNTATTTPTHEGNGIWSLPLTATEMEAEVNVVTLSDGATDIEDQAIIISTFLGHQVAAFDGIEKYQINTASVAAATDDFEADRQWGRSDEATADHFNDRIIVFISGSLKGQSTEIEDYALQNARGFFTVAALTEVPADNDYFLIF